MSVFVEEFVARLGWQVDNRKLAEANQQFANMKRAVAGVAVAITGAAAGLVAFITSANKALVVQTNTARAFGFSAEAMENWGYALSEIGVSTESFIRTAKSLNVQLGGMEIGAGNAAATDALAALNLKYADLKGLSPEAQFLRIAEAARTAEHGQMALAAAQALLGREGPKLIGRFRALGREVSTFIDHSADLNLMTEEAREGAALWYSGWDDVENVTDSAKGLIAGLSGKALAPLLAQMTDWVALNRELIQQKVKEWAERAAKFVSRVWSILRKIVSVVDDVIDRFGGFDKAIRVVGAALAGLALVSTISMISKFVTALKGATLAQWLFNAAVGFWPLLVALAAAALYLIYDDIATYLRGGESLTGDIINSIKGLWAEAVAVVEGYIDSAARFWADALGVSKEDLDGALLASWEALDAFFTKWSERISFVKNIFSGIFDGLVDSFKRIFGLIADLDAKMGQLPIIGRLLQGIPIIGSRLFGGKKTDADDNGAAWAGVKNTLADKMTSALPGTQNLADYTLRSPVPTAPMPSKSVSTAISTSRSTKSTSINAPANITITQQPGENAKDLAARVKKIWEENVAQSIRANDSGVEY